MDRAFATKSENVIEWATTIVDKRGMFSFVVDSSKTSKV